MKTDTFSGFHPAVNFAYFLCVIGMTILIMQPIFLVLSLAGGCAYLLYLQGRKGMRRQVGYLLPILVMMAILNPLFNHEGVTVLFYLPNDNPVTVEAMAYGLGAAAMMGASIVWFNCCNTVFTSDKIIYLFGRVIPALSLLISMTLRFVPRFKNYLQNVLRVQQALHKPETAMEKLRQALSAFSATVSWAMEQSIVASDSMKSRGFGEAGRTAYSIYRFDKRDGATLLILAALCLGAAAPALSGALVWEFYPRLSGTLLGPVQFFAYLCYGGICAMPLFIDRLEDHKWNSLRSGI